MKIKIQYWYKFIEFHSFVACKSKFKIYNLLLNSIDEKYLMHFDERYLIKYKTMTSLLYQNIYLSYVRGYLNVAVQDNQCINHMFINTFWSHISNEILPNTKSNYTQFRKTYIAYIWISEIFVSNFRILNRNTFWNHVITFEIT